MRKLLILFLIASTVFAQERYAPIKKYSGSGVPSAPVLALPADGATGTTLTPTLSWNASLGAVSYRTQVSTVNTFASTVFDQSPIASTSVPASGLSYSTQYYWRVNATNPGGTSDWSSTRSFTTTVAPPPIPAPPVLATPAAGAINQPIALTFVWNVSANATEYRFQIASNTSFSSPMYDQLGLTVTTTPISGLPNNTTLYWRVNASNISGTSAWAAYRSFITIPASVPTAPILATPANGATGISTSPTLTWNTSATATSYRAQVSIDPAFGTTVYNQGSIVGTSAGISGLAGSTTYYWRVNATNAVGTGGYSTIWQFTTGVVSAAPLQVAYYPTWCYGANSRKMHPRTGVPWSRIDILVSFAATFRDSWPYFGPVGGGVAADSLDIQYGLGSSLGYGAYGNWLDTLVRTGHSYSKKVIVCWGVIGGGSHTVFSDSATLEVAVYNIAHWVQRKNMDGADIDWEYPDSATNHGRYLRFMRRAFDALNDGKHYLVTTCSVNENTVYGSDNTPNSCDAAVDYYLCQLYSNWSVNAGGHNVFTWISPQGNTSCPNQDGPYSWANTGAAAMVAHGHPKAKCMNLFPMYGYEMTGTTAYCSTAPGDDGGTPWTDLESSLTKGGVKTWDNTAKEYMISGTATSSISGLRLSVGVGQQFTISYGDTGAARARARWVIDNGYPGMGLWELSISQRVIDAPASDTQNPGEAIIWHVFNP